MSNVIFRELVDGSQLQVAMSSCCDAPVELVTEGREGVDYAHCTGCRSYLCDADPSGYRPGGLPV